MVFRLKAFSFAMAFIAMACTATADEVSLRDFRSSMKWDDVAKAASKHCRSIPRRSKRMIMARNCYGGLFRNMEFIFRNNRLDEVTGGSNISVKSMLEAAKKKYGPKYVFNRNNINMSYEYWFANFRIKIAKYRGTNYLRIFLYHPNSAKRTKFMQRLNIRPKL